MNKLTCIISFKNEGDEVLKTAASIRNTCGNDVDILLINDGSEDNFDYKRVAIDYDCSYIKNQESIGASMGKLKGVDLCKTPYFIILDGHMRFYQKGWHLKVIATLEAYPNSIICCNTVPLLYDENNKTELPLEKVLETYGGMYGAKLVEDPKPGYEFDIKWHNKPKSEVDTENSIYETYCILGGCYAASKKRWNELGGYNGLLGYGFEEIFISLKNELLGGINLHIHDIYICHKFRSKFPYHVDSGVFNGNRKFLLEYFKDLNLFNK